MGLIDEVAAASKPIQECKFGRWLGEQSETYRVEVGKALGSEYPTNVIWRVLVGKHGQFVSASVFARHRDGRCACGS